MTSEAYQIQSPPRSRHSADYFPITPSLFCLNVCIRERYESDQRRARRFACVPLILLPQSIKDVTTHVFALRTIEGPSKSEDEETSKLFVTQS
jgi:hypothetical protein